MAKSLYTVNEQIKAFLAGKTVSAPFDMVTQAGHYHCQQILRLLVGRRLVVKAEHQGQPVLLKLFKPSRKGQRELAREIKGYQSCKRAGVAVPEQVLINENLSDCLAVGYEFLADSVPFDGTFSDSSLAEKLIQLMLQCHRGGIYQQDIHPDNILLTQQGLVLIDMASVRGKAGKPLSKDKSLTNLALLIAQFQPDQQAILLQHLERYFQQRGWSFDTKAKQSFNKRLNRVWQKRKKNYLKKCFRPCTMTAYKKTTKIEYAFKRPFLEAVTQDLIHQIDTLVEQGKVLKAGNSATVVVTRLAGQDVVIKRYNIKSFWHFLKRCWRPSRAANAWRFGNLLELIDISTPKVLGFIENRQGPLRKTAYLICALSTDAEELNRVFPDALPPQRIMEQVERIFSLMARYKLSHGDLKASNLLLNADRQVELIDLDAMQEHRISFFERRAQQQDKRRFLRNWSKQELT